MNNSIADKLEQIAKNEQKVYAAGKNKGYTDGYAEGEALGYENGEADGYNKGYTDGYEKGKAEGGDTEAAYEQGKADGKQAEYDAFWDKFQNYGEPKNYGYVFAYETFTDETYNPKYPINCIYNQAMSGQYVFSYSKITNTKVAVICGANRTMAGTFANSKIETIPKFVVLETNAFTNTFQNCTALKNITIEGVIANNISFAESSLLSRESIESIINALSTATSGLTVTISKTAKENAFTDEEWASLIATKPNWTISLA